jgi:putative DNA primase/helicase
MSGGNWHAFDREVRVRVRELALELLGKPGLRTPDEWRWGRKGSLSLVMSGERAGLWFDHELGQGGGFAGLVAHHLRMGRREALEWIAGRVGVTLPSVSGRTNAAEAILLTLANSRPKAQPVRDDGPAKNAAERAARIWNHAEPAPADHPYLVAKHVTPLALRADEQGRLIVPLQDADSVLHSLEFISADGAKRYLAGGAKRGHFAVVGQEPAPLSTPEGPILVCEGWATGASLSMATGHTVIAAMDAGNLLPVAEALRSRFPEADLVVVADNDDKPGRMANPGVVAARKTAAATDARLAIPTIPGDANDLFCAEGIEAVATLVASAARIPQPGPAYAEPALSVDEARASLADAITRFMEDVRHWWAGVDEPAILTAQSGEGEAAHPWFDFNDVQMPPPLLGLPVDVGLGKTSATREATAGLIASRALGGRKVVFAVPRHDLGAEQVTVFREMGVSAMLWKGRTAPDPVPHNPEQLMCLDPGAPFDALEVEHPVEQSCCKLRQDGVTLLCPLYGKCSYQRQKPLAMESDVIVCAHDSLFHMKAEAIGTVGLLVIDEGFWQAGLRGLDGKAKLTLDGLEPVRSSPVCYDGKNKLHIANTADLVAARMKLWKALHVSEPGVLRQGLLAATGLTVEECRTAAGLERRRLRSAGLHPGMDPAERRARIAKIMPPDGMPWAPPGRCAILWLILAEALENGHDAAGVELFHDRTEAGSVKSLRLRWRSRLRGGWAAGVPILHLDATLRPELVEPYLPYMEIGALVAARQPHVRVRQVTQSPTSAKALTPLAEAPARDQKAAATHLRDLMAWIRLRARQCHRPDTDMDVLVIGQKAAVGALRAKDLPPNVDAVHFNGLSGFDRWGGVRCLIVLGRTLPAPTTAEWSAVAINGRVPVPNPEDAGWWYPLSEKRLRLASGRTLPLMVETHADPIAEAIRWSICEGELIQAIGRGRGVNCTAETPLEIDLLTDAVLPLTVQEVVSWQQISPSRHDLMALDGVVLENAADMARCFPDLWPSRDAAKKDSQRRGTNCYYKDLYNSKLSPSSAWVTYQPEGAGQRTRTALFDTSIIPDPEEWLTKRLGPFARCEIAMRVEDMDVADGEVKTSANSNAEIDDFEGVPNAPDANPAASEQAGAPPHACDVPNHPPTEEISS